MVGVRRLGPVLAVVLCIWTLSSAQETAEVFQGEAAERFLRDARITSMRGLGQGLTAPSRATLEQDGVTRQAVFKTVDLMLPGVTTLNNGQVEVNLEDTWRTEIAAYELDRMIGLGMVPATVRREHRGRTGSLQWWVESEWSEAERRRKKAEPLDREDWNRQQLKMQLFDNLIYNTDRHLNNILVTKEFQLRLIDHSRSFRSFDQIRSAAELPRFSRSLLAGLERLQRDDLRRRLGSYVPANRLDALLKRRDAIVALARTRVATQGEAAVLYP